MTNAWPASKAMRGPGPAPARTSAGRAAAALLLSALLLSGCARQMPGAVSAAPGTPGFLAGLWHGFVFPLAWVASLFDPDIAVYAVPNNGGWYDFGYFVGIVFFGVGARKTKTVTVIVDRWRER